MSFRSHWLRVGRRKAAWRNLRAKGGHKRTGQIVLGSQDRLERVGTREQMVIHLGESGVLWCKPRVPSKAAKAVLRGA